MATKPALPVPHRPAGLPSASFGELPELLAEIAEVVGIEAAVAIAEVKGGARAHFPATAPDEHWLVQAIGREKADLLCDHFRVNHTGGIMLHVPLGPKSFYARARRRAVELRESLSIRQTALALGVTTRAVEKWTAASKSAKDDDQGRLF